MLDNPKSHLVTENEGPAMMPGRTAVHLDRPAAERQRRARALKNSEIRYRRLFETAPYGILVLDGETGVVVDVNPCMCQLVGYEQGEILQHPLWAVAAFKNAADTKNQFRDLLNRSHIRYDDLPLETKDGQIKHVELVSTLFLAENKQFVQCTVHDITDRIRREQENGARARQADLDAARNAHRTTQQTIHDDATGLVNRWYLEETLPRELHRSGRANVPLTVTALDLDRLEQVTEQFGADAGDALLSEAGRVIREHLRKSDMACRYDGQEFILVLPNSSSKATLERLQQIQVALKELELYHGDQLLNGLSVSAGIATAGPDGTTTQELVTSAREALHQAKRSGGDRVVHHQSEEKK